MQRVHLDQSREQLTKRSSNRRSWTKTMILASISPRSATSSLTHLPKPRLSVSVIRVTKTKLTFWWASTTTASNCTKLRSRNLQRKRQLSKTALVTLKLTCKESGALQLPRMTICLQQILLTQSSCGLWTSSCINRGTNSRFSANRPLTR